MSLGHVYFTGKLIMAAEPHGELYIPGMSTAVLGIDNLSKRFGKRWALDGLSLEVPEGEIFGFLGPNGAGKSTTIRILLSLIKPTSGHSTVFGQSIKSAYPGYLAHVGALVETPDFYENLSALANLKMLARLYADHGRRISDDRCLEVLDLVGLLDRADDHVRAFSHGMKQRLGIGQAVLHHPRLLILDEPSSGLDPQGMREVRDLIRGLAKDDGMTVFLSTHLLHEVEQICTSMAVLNEGKLLVTGPVETFLSEKSASLTELWAEPLEAANRVLEGLDQVSEIAIYERHIRFRVDHDNRPVVAAALAEAKVKIYSLTPVSRLEDYFLSLFGHRELP
ncbi:MAG: ABC transporter ATP-binding protein [Candidatus Marinimicrobia bacterium]|nr:ABC transporter ATP-binding protein [Candidatus Neomarinimicrobiota bacterium]